MSIASLLRRGLPIAVVAVFIAAPLVWALNGLRMRTPPAAVESQAISAALDVAGIVSEGTPPWRMLALGRHTTGPASLLGALTAWFVSAGGCAPLGATRLTAWLLVLVAIVFAAVATGRAAGRLDPRVLPPRVAAGIQNLALCAGVAAAVALALCPWLLNAAMTYGTAGPVAFCTAATLVLYQCNRRRDTAWSRLDLALVLIVSILAQAEWGLAWMPVVIAALIVNAALRHGMRDGIADALTAAGVVALAAFWRQDLWLGVENSSAFAFVVNGLLLVGGVTWLFWLRRTATRRRALLALSISIVAFAIWWLGSGENHTVVAAAVRSVRAMPADARQLYLRTVLQQQCAGSLPALALLGGLALFGTIMLLRSQPGIAVLIVGPVLLLRYRLVPERAALTSLIVILSIPIGCAVAVLAMWLHAVATQWIARARAAWLVRRGALIAGACAWLIVALYGLLLLHGALPRAARNFEPGTARAVPMLDPTRSLWRAIDAIAAAVPPSARVSYTPDQHAFSRFTLDAVARARGWRWQLVPWPDMNTTPVPAVADYFVVLGPVAAGGGWFQGDHLVEHCNRQIALLDNDSQCRLIAAHLLTNAQLRLRIYARGAAAADANDK